MVRAYSLDLRERVVAFLEKGNDTKSASETFDVSQRTVQRWLKQKTEKGTLKPIRREFAYRKIDHEKLKSYIEKKPDQFLCEIAQKFSVTLQAIFYACKRLGITRKKNEFLQRKGLGKEKSFS